MGAPLLIAINLLLQTTLCFASEVSYIYEGQYVNREDQNVGYSPIPNAQAVVEKKYGSQKVYKVEYRFDSFGRRISKNNSSLDQKFFAAFFGGSNTFGEGLPVEESIPFLVEKATQDLKSYNYGFQGYGINNILMQLNTHDLKKELPESNGYGFYLYHHFHRHRLIGTARYFSWSQGLSPSLSIKDDQVVNLGLFSTARPFYYHSLRLLELSGFLNWFNIDYPNILSNEANELLCKTILEARSVFEKSLQKARFVVVIDFNTPEEDTLVSHCLDTQSISYIDLRPYRPYQHSEYKIMSGVDDHNNLKANQLIATKIVEWMKKEKP